MPASVVVLGFDGSAPSESAARWAAVAADSRGAALRIVYASRDRSDDGQEILEQGRRLVQRIRSELPVFTEIGLDSPAAALIRASAEASLVAVGNRGHGGFHDLLVGSTSLHTAMHAHSPVAVIRPTRLPEAGVGEAGHIVVGVDGPEQSHRALEFAFAEARRSRLPITAVHVWEAPIPISAPGGMPWVADFETIRENAEKLLHQVIAPWRERYPDVEVSAKTVEGPVPAVLVQESMGAQMIVVGTRGAGGFAGLLLGSASQALVHHAGCPVVVAHAADSVADSRPDGPPEVIA